MTDWIDPAAWEQVAKTTATVLDVLAKLRDVWARRKKAIRPEDTRALDKEFDAQQAELQKLVDALSAYFESHRRFMEAVVNLLGPMDAPDGEKNVDKWIKLINQLGLVTRATVSLNQIVPDHGRRLLALERAPADRGDRAPKRKRRRK